MTRKRLVVIDGHPDPDAGRFIHALANSYADGATAGGHEVRLIRLAALDFPLVTSRQEWEGETGNPVIREAQETIAWAQHLTILYPLWLGDVPALLKAFLEQVMRPGFAFAYREGKLPEKKLKGHTARLVVTMGMPAFFYRAFYGAHSVKSFERNILRFVGIQPFEHLLLGNVEADADKRDSWLEEIFELGKRGI
ncbi:NAD(P)H-dependent oxidoreductase [Sphingobium nicotianae]|uniref:NAD(P)H-dependent oxidoreductase n=1 Tax=Sphingobium nicotianae TaxID=2782607 RepID=A0A9X1DGR2_9SPHN|nr:NAD(P)H-dependent oxidoreductase [Sphingobium nicotianae]MBT2189048.1 NAD(P)H-dependent oxidoreductase [Sphingobium nicotianae]